MLKNNNISYRCACVCDLRCVSSSHISAFPSAHACFPCVFVWLSRSRAARPDTRIDGWFGLPHATIVVPPRPARARSPNLQRTEGDTIALQPPGTRVRLREQQRFDLYRAPSFSRSRSVFQVTRGSQKRETYEWTLLIPAAMIWICECFHSEATTTFLINYLLIYIK